MKKWLTLFLLLFSCSHNGPQWEYQQFPTTTPGCPYRRLILPPCAIYNSLEIEFTSGPEGIRMYLNVFSIGFPTDPNDPKIVHVSLAIGVGIQDVCAYRFDGGQRALMPDIITKDIIDSLLSQVPVKISVGCYSTIIDPTTFCERYLQFTK